MNQDRSLEGHITTIARWIVGSEHIVAFTGAGISTDSGIPDFRGPNGVWTRRDAGLPPPGEERPERRGEVLPTSPTPREEPPAGEERPERRTP